MKKLLSLIIAVITFYGCQDDILSEEYQENVPATRASVGSSDYYYYLVWRCENPTNGQREQVVCFGWNRKIWKCSQIGRKYPWGKYQNYW